MANQPPANLTFPDSSLTIIYEENANLNITKNSIVIEGTVGGFLSLANAVFFYLNDLQDIMELSSLPYVTADIRFSIVCEETVNDAHYGTIHQTSQGHFQWKMSESEICRVASEIHSLGYVNKELHLDEGKASKEISVYCVLSKL